MVDHILFGHGNHSNKTSTGIICRSQMVPLGWSIYHTCKTFWSCRFCNAIAAWLQLHLFFPCESTCGCLDKKAKKQKIMLQKQNSLNLGTSKETGYKHWSHSRSISHIAHASPKNIHWQICQYQFCYLANAPIIYV